MEYPSRAAAIAAVARQEGVGRESLRRWVVQAEIDTGARDGVTSSEAAEIKALKAENRRLREDVAIRALRRRSMWGSSTPATVDSQDFIDQMRAEGFAARVGLPGSAVRRAVGDAREDLPGLA